MIFAGGLLPGRAVDVDGGKPGSYRYTNGPDAERCYDWTKMSNALKARVTNGRIVLDEPTDLPDGTILELVPGVELDDLDDEDRAKLHAAIHEGLEQGRRGEARPVDEALAELRTRR